MEVVTETVPLSTLIRWYIYDLQIKDANKLAAEFDLMPVSEEGEQKELDDAEARVDRIYSLLPLVEVFSEINAKAVLTLQTDEMIEMGMKPEQLAEEAETLKGFYQSVSAAALISMLSSALELGIIEVRGSLVDIEEVV